MATHSGTLAWKTPWTEEPGRLQSMGSLRVRHDRATSLSLFTFMHWRRKWKPTPAFLPGESQGRGSLEGCRLWGRTESDTTEATQQQQQHNLELSFFALNGQILKTVIVSLSWTSTVASQLLPDSILSLFFHVIFLYNSQQYLLSSVKWTTPHPEFNLPQGLPRMKCRLMKWSCINLPRLL